MPTQPAKSGTGNVQTPSYCAAYAAEWTAQVLEREQGLPAANWAGAVNPRICTKDDWKEVWPEDHKDWFADFDERHLAVAARLDSGDIEVQIPWRTKKGANKAGAPEHYMQFLYLKDEQSDIRAVAKFESTDTVFPFVFPGSTVAGASEITPYSIDVIVRRAASNTAAPPPARRGWPIPCCCPPAAQHGVWKGETLKL